jgi:hypothetical protein
VLQLVLHKDHVQQHLHKNHSTDQTIVQRLTYPSNSPTPHFPILFLQTQEEIEAKVSTPATGN